MIQQMKEMILKTTQEKLSEGFNINFVPRKQFEQEFSIVSKLWLETFTSITRAYEKLKSKQSRKLVIISKNIYIAEQFYYQRWYNRPSSPMDITKSDLEKLKSSDEVNYKKFEDAYNQRFQSETKVVVSLKDYIIESFPGYAAENEHLNSSSISTMFWEYFKANNQRYDFFSIDYRKEIFTHFTRVIDEFKENYLSNKYFQLYDKAEKILSDISFSGFEKYVVNIGNRDFIRGNSGWMTNSFEVINHGNKFSFTSSVKDEKTISGGFINIYIFQYTKKHLLKLSITLDEIEQTTYIIWKEFEKVTVKNECEIFIAKHHGNENIIFDTRAEALNFQSKVIEIKENLRK